jgi:hypothetical protein
LYHRISASKLKQIAQYARCYFASALVASGFDAMWMPASARIVGNLLIDLLFVIEPTTWFTSALMV